MLKRPPGALAVLEVFLGDFLQRQEAVALGAVVDEAGFEAGFDPGDAAFVDVGFFLFPGRYFDVEIVDSLSINQCDAQLLFLSCVDEHSLHETLLSIRKGPRNHARRAPAVDGRSDRGMTSSDCCLRGLCDPARFLS